MRGVHRAFSGGRGFFLLRQVAGRREEAAKWARVCQALTIRFPRQALLSGRRVCCPVLLLCSWLIFSLVGPATFSAARAEALVPGAGMLLVAAPALTDPNFARTVVLLCDHSDEGTLGLVLNRPTDLALADAFPDVSPLNQMTSVLFAGGPVQPGAVLALLRTSRPPIEAHRILDHVYLSSSLDTVVPFLTSPQGDEGVRLFSGYAGWGPGQLNAELGAGAWVLVPGDAAQIFASDHTRVWSELIQQHRAPTLIRVYRDRLPGAVRRAQGEGSVPVPRKGRP